VNSGIGNSSSNSLPQQEQQQLCYHQCSKCGM